MTGIDVVTNSEALSHGGRVDMHLGESKLVASESWRLSVMAGLWSRSCHTISIWRATSASSGNIGAPVTCPYHPHTSRFLHIASVD
ncbi:hypothetical protein J6590_029474 [Homalodisca vitripennis]|nr:hypothetical protein J6590_029474 [Homalodisca vitripennis]